MIWIGSRYGRNLSVVKKALFQGTVKKKKKAEEEGEEEEEAIQQKIYKAEK